MTDAPPSGSTGPERILARLRSVETSTYLIGAGLVIAFMAGWLANSAIGGDSSPVVVVSSSSPPAPVPTSAAPTTDAAVTSEPAVSDPAAEQTTDPSQAVAAPPELPAGTVPAAPIAKFSCPAATVTVGDAGELVDALRKAGPGTVIQLKDGLYQGDGEFTASAKGTASDPIYLCGGRGAILQGQGFKADYVLHFENAANWRVDGFTVRFGQKGIVVDTGTGIALQNLLVADIGDEAVHLRNNSTGDVVRGLTIRNTGNRRDKFGEGVYVGTAESNWPTITGGQPDHSDRNFVLDNVISQTTSESVDIKEGTTGGVVAGNTFDGSKLTGADSWVDVKGDGWLIAGNRGRTSPKDGFQTHVILKGWGDANLFTDNVADLDGGSGVGFYLHEQLTNKVSCTNQVTGAEGGLSNYPCSG